MTHVADTHSLVWYLEDNPRLGSDAREALRNPETRLVIPTIVLAEIAFLYGRQRIAVDLPEVYRRIADATNTVIYPLDEAVVEKSPSSLNIHDGIIVATALLFRDVLGETTAVISKDTEIDVVWQTRKPPHLSSETAARSGPKVRGSAREEAVNGTVSVEADHRAIPT